MKAKVEIVFNEGKIQIKINGLYVINRKSRKPIWFFTVERARQFLDLLSQDSQATEVAFGVRVPGLYIDPFITAKYHSVFPA